MPHAGQIRSLGCGNSVIRGQRAISGRRKNSWVSEFFLRPEIALCPRITVSSETNVKTLILLRHGESTWNKENRFTGWTDVDLSPKGIDEARTAGRQLLSDGYGIDVAFTSVLKRAIRTLWLALDEMDRMWIPVYKTWRLNERHYGAL